ncbi:hypothetical protein BHM03_00038926 [Ensete ventricosum]|nr:hypothetical protein BHM03_00038926 [Ensete ventricosum]
MICGSTEVEAAGGGCGRAKSSRRLVLTTEASCCKYRSPSSSAFVYRAGSTQGSPVLSPERERENEIDRVLAIAVVLAALLCSAQALELTPRDVAAMDTKEHRQRWRGEQRQAGSGEAPPPQQQKRRARPTFPSSKIQETKMGGRVGARDSIKTRITKHQPMRSLHSFEEGNRVKLWEVAMLIKNHRENASGRGTDDDEGWRELLADCPMSLSGDRVQLRLESEESLPGRKHDGRKEEASQSSKMQEHDQQFSVGYVSCAVLSGRDNEEKPKQGSRRSMCNAAPSSPPPPPPFPLDTNSHLLSTHKLRMEEGLPLDPLGQDDLHGCPGLAEVKTNTLLLYSLCHTQSMHAPTLCFR